MIFFKVIFLSLFFLQVQANGLLSDNVLTFLDKRYTFTVDDMQHVPCNLSYIFADVKFDGKNLKVCEFGPAPCAGFVPSRVLVNGVSEELRAPYWGLFWHLVAQQGLPFWLVGGDHSVDYDDFLFLGGHHVLSLNALEHDECFQYSARQASINQNRLNEHAGIIVCFGKNKEELLNQLKKKYSSFLWVNAGTQKFASSKDALNPFFRAPELRRFKPAWNIYPKKYTRSLADTIIQDLHPVDYFIIKPINALQSRGVMMVHAKHLDRMLKCIFSKSGIVHGVRPHGDRYWLYDQNKSFLVEEYAPSKTIIVDGRPYDPTMRLVFFMTHEQGVLNIHVLAGYWKIPVKPLDADGNLSAQHITIAFSGKKFTGIQIDPADLQCAGGELAQMLSKLYPAMLKAAMQLPPI